MDHFAMQTPHEQPFKTILDIDGFT